MPIEVSIGVESVSQSEFDSIDRVVMRCAFAAQNRFGRLCDERIYENDVAARLVTEGIALVRTQVPIFVSHRTFAKTYFLDLVARRMVYEFKSENCLSPAHESQALNYAALLGIKRIKLINFGGELVHGKLIATPFAEVDRRDITFNLSKWRPLSPSCEDLVQVVKELLLDIGGYLSVSLYENALMQLVGGESACVRRLSVSRDGMVMGTHRTLLHGEACAFVVTTFGRDLAMHVRQFYALAASLPVAGIQIIDVHHREVQFVTVP